MNISNNLIFSGSEPNLIDEKLIKKIDKLFQTQNLSGWEKIYQIYIKPNSFAIIVFVVIICFLIMRYYIKKYKEKQPRLVKKKTTETKEPPKNIETFDNDDNIDIDDIDEIDDIDSNIDLEFCDTDE